MTIWKYPLGTDLKDLTITPPSGARPLCVQKQSGMPQLWMLVDPDNPPEPRHIIIVGTGWDLSKCMAACDYVGTFQTDGGVVVWHVFLSPSRVTSPPAAEQAEMRLEAP